MRKIVYSVVKLEIEKRNGVLLTEEKDYKNGTTKLDIKCLKCENIWHPCFSSIKNNNTWCPKCAILKPQKTKYTYEFVKGEIEKRDGTLISKEYININTPLEVQCNVCNTIWYPRFCCINRGNWCPNCAGRIEISLQDVQKVAIEKGGKCLSLKYINVDTKMEWECQFGHKWFADFYHIKSRKQWCPECNGSKKHTLEDCINLAISKNGKCLSTEYINLKTKMEWECEKGHRWKTTFINIQRGTWCPYCSGLIKPTIEDVYKIAEEKGGKCLSNEYFNAHTKLDWECSEGHMWSANLNSIKRGTWCPCCSSKKSQKELYNLVKKILNTEVFSSYKKFPWLYNQKTKGIQEIDIYVPFYKLAIEYDGQQHFIPIRFGGMTQEQAKKNLKSQKHRDRLKDKKIRAHPEDITYFIRFKYDEELTEVNLKDKLIKHKVINEVII